MDDKWYYVEEGERRGPVELSGMNELIANSKLGEDDYVWKKGFENWVKLKEVSEFQGSQESVVSEESTAEIVEEAGLSFSELISEGNNIFIKIGADRGGVDTEYGPYSLDIVKKLFKESRINEKTFLFIRGMSDWSIIGDFSDFSDVFNTSAAVIEDSERRESKRKPFIARMYLESQKEVYMGICRDISIGGMQVLIDLVPEKIGQNISINVHPENTEHHFVASGEVVRLLDGGQGFSFRFIDLSDEAKLSIQDYLAHD